MTVRVNLDLPNEYADAVDALARPLGRSRNSVLVEAVRDYLRSRCLIDQEPAPAAEPAAPAVEREPARAKHRWNERVKPTRDEPALRSKHGAGR